MTRTELTELTEPFYRLFPIPARMRNLPEFGSVGSVGSVEPLFKGELKMLSQYTKLDVIEILRLRTDNGLTNNKLQEWIDETLREHPCKATLGPYWRYWLQLCESVKATRKARLPVGRLLRMQVKLLIKMIPNPGDSLPQRQTDRQICLPFTEGEQSKEA